MRILEEKCEEDVGRGKEYPELKSSYQAKWKQVEAEQEGTILETIVPGIAMRVSTHGSKADEKDREKKDEPIIVDPNSVDPSCVCVFVDPLDMTSAYAKENMNT